jgi:hypothetical protein
LADGYCHLLLFCEFILRNYFDMSLLKNTRISERVSAQFRAEFFNIFNHAQFMNPSGNINSSSFGMVLSARDPRIGQVALKILF